MFSASWCLLLWRVQETLAVRKPIGVEKQTAFSSSSFLSDQTKKDRPLLLRSDLSFDWSISFFFHLYNPGRHTFPWAVLLWQNYSDIIQVYCSMAGQGCTLAVFARPDNSHMLHIVWFVGHTDVCFGVLCNSKSRKGHTTALYRSRMSLLYDWSSFKYLYNPERILPPGRFTLTKLLWHGSIVL